MFTLIAAGWAFCVGALVGMFATYDAVSSIPTYDEDDWRLYEAERQKRQVDALIYSCGGRPPHKEETA